MRDEIENTGGFTNLMYQMATAETMTSHQAAELLKQNARIRTLRETLGRYARVPADDKKALQTYLTDALMAHSPQGTVRKNVERKVRMWMEEDVRSISKQGAVQLCFALGLRVEEAGEFLCRSCGENFHWRDPHDIVYLFALREGLNYVDALALERDMAAKGLLDVCEQNDPLVMTQVTRQDAEKIGSAVELEAWLRESKGRLGSLHNTAYGFFRGYLELLADPDARSTPGPEEQTKNTRGLPPAVSMPVREITDVYLYHRLIPRAKRAKNKDARTRMLSAIERDVQQNWPDETTLSKMLNRKLDVSRKALILLFLATDGDTLEDVEADDRWSADFARKQNLDCEEAEQQWRETHEDDFEDMYARMNTMLADCGFAQLDPRVPFDWMILYCMCVDESMMIDSRVQQFLSELFQTSGLPDSGGNGCQ